MDQRWAGWWTAVALLALLSLGTVFYLRNRAPAAGPTPPPAGPSGEEQGVQVYFTQPAGAGLNEVGVGLDRHIVRDIEAATSTVDAALYDLNLWSIRDALIEAHRRGLRVRMVVEADNQMRTEIEDLRAAGIPIVSDGRPPLMHHKFIVIDDERVWTGSMNFTLNGVYRNDNNLLLLRSPELARDYTREFEEMFAEGRFGQLSRVDTPYPFLAVGDTAVEVAFAPEDGAQAKVLRWLDSAQSSVQLLAFNLTADPVAEALLEASARGVVVRGVVEAGSADSLGSDVHRLRSEGLAIRLDSNPATMHHKVIVIDGESVVAGSYNFTRSAEERNDENMLVLIDEELAAAFAMEFERLYVESLP